MDNETSKIAEKITLTLNSVLRINRIINHQRTLCPSYLSNPFSRSVIPTIRTQLWVLSSVQDFSTQKINTFGLLKNSVYFRFKSPERTLKDLCEFPGELVWDKKDFNSIVVAEYKSTVRPLPFYKEATLKSGFSVQLASGILNNSMKWSFHTRGDIE
jgi:hypothetical protein